MPWRKLLVKPEKVGISKSIWNGRPVAVWHAPLYNTSPWLSKSRVIPNHVKGKQEENVLLWLVRAALWSQVLRRTSFLPTKQRQYFHSRDTRAACQKHRPLVQRVLQGMNERVVLWILVVQWESRKTTSGRCSHSADTSAQSPPEHKAGPRSAFLPTLFALTPNSTVRSTVGTWGAGSAVVVSQSRCS